MTATMSLISLILVAAHVEMIYTVQHIWRSINCMHFQGYLGNAGLSVQGSVTREFRVTHAHDTCDHCEDMNCAPLQCLVSICKMYT